MFFVLLTFFDKLNGKLKYFQEVKANIKRNGKLKLFELKELYNVTHNFVGCAKLFSFVEIGKKMEEVAKLVMMLLGKDNKNKLTDVQRGQIYKILLKKIDKVIEN